MLQTISGYVLLLNVGLEPSVDIPFSLFLLSGIEQFMGNPQYSHEHPRTYSFAPVKWYSVLVDGYKVFR